MSGGGKPSDSHDLFSACGTGNCRNGQPFAKTPLFMYPMMNEIPLESVASNLVCLPWMYALIDSGSAVTACPKSHAEHIQIRKSSDMPMMGAGSDHKLVPEGRRQVPYQTRGGVELHMDYVATHVRCPIIATSRLITKGVTVAHTRSRDWLEFPGGEQENLVKMRGTSCLPLRVRELVNVFEDVGTGGASSSTAVAEPIHGEVAESVEQMAIPPKTRPSPLDPTPVEREQHNITHCPFRSWCIHCVAGKAADWPHCSVKRGESEVPIVQLDYFFINRAGDAHILTIQNCIICETRALCSVVGLKGPNLYQAEVFVSFLEGRYWRGFYTYRQRVCRASYGPSYQRIKESKHA